jgi:hypothetical protein
MNERIRELREQALRWAGENVNRNLYSNYEIEQKEYEKFAELIVRECALVVHKKTGAKSALNVLEHFGVEE